MRRMILAAGLIGLAATSVAQAQQPAQPAADRMRFGVQVSWADDADIGIGAHLDYPMNRLFNNQPIFAQVSGDFFFPGNDITYFELNWNLNYKFAVRNSPIAPYAGAGLNFAYVDANCPVGVDCSSTDLGLNLVGGMRFPNAGRLLPFVQARFEISGGEQFVLSGGIHF